MAVESYFGECNERRARLSAGARDVLEAIFLELNELMAQSETANRIMSSLRKFHPAVHDRVLHEGAEKNRRNIREMLEKGIDDGFFVADFNLDLAITMLYHTASVLVKRRDLVLPEGMTEREAFIQVISTFFRGIATAKGLELIDEYKNRIVSGTDRA